MRRLGPQARADEILVERDLAARPDPEAHGVGRERDVDHRRHHQQLTRPDTRALECGGHAIQSDGAQVCGVRRTMDVHGRGLEGIVIRGVAGVLRVRGDLEHEPIR